MKKFIVLYFTVMLAVAMVANNMTLTAIANALLTGIWQGIGLTMGVLFVVLAVGELLDK